MLDADELLTYVEYAGYNIISQEVLLAGAGMNYEYFCFLCILYDIVARENNINNSRATYVALI